MQPRSRSAGEDDPLQHAGPPRRREGMQLSKAKPLAIVPAGLHRVAPVAVLEIPGRRLREALFERVARRPAELSTDLRRVDCVSAIVAGPIRDERLQVAIAAAG